MLENYNVSQSIVADSEKKYYNNNLQFFGTEKLNQNSKLCLFFRKFSHYKKCSLQKGRWKFQSIVALNNSLHLGLSGYEIKMMSFPWQV